jgi:WD40-like Beta Propeller Repeat
MSTERTWICVIAAVVALVAVPSAAAHVESLTPWSAASNLEAVPGTSPDANTPYLDGCPFTAPDGLSLYIASDRPGGLGGIDIWVARREKRGAPWGAPQNLGPPVNSPADDFAPLRRAAGGSSSSARGRADAAEAISTPRAGTTVGGASPRTSAAG